MGEEDKNGSALQRLRILAAPIVLGFSLGGGLVGASLLCCEPREAGTLADGGKKFDTGGPVPDGDEWPEDVSCAESTTEAPCLQVPDCR